jgi:hypothetical protein
VEVEKRFTYRSDGLLSALFKPFGAASIAEYPSPALIIGKRIPRSILFSLEFKKFIFSGHEVGLLRSGIGRGGCPGRLPI